MTQHTTGNRTEATGQVNNAQRMLTLTNILENKIKDKSLIGIATWSEQAYKCMLYIEIDNKLYII